MVFSIQNPTSYWGTPMTIYGTPSSMVAPLKYGCGVGQGRVDRTDVAAQDYQLDLTEAGQ